MSAIIKVFQVGARTYKHVINAARDAVELQDESNAVLLVFGADAEGTRPGRTVWATLSRFSTACRDGSYYELPHQSRRVLSPDRHVAEVEVSKQYLGALSAAV